LTLRLLSAGAVLIGTTGCGYYWALQEPIETGCASLSSYYLDVDGDNWGASGSGVMLCRANPETGHTAQNGWDCDDDDPAVSGQITAVCPDMLVSGGAEYRAVVYGSTEFVAVYGDTAVVTATVGQSSCGPYGWGGKLASFDSQADLTAVKDALTDDELYAGFIDVGWDRVTEAWVWGDGSTMDLDSVGWCGGVVPTLADYDEYLDPDSKTYNADVDAIRISLVKDFQYHDWCLGEPRDALPPIVDTGMASEYPFYSSTAGHFVCEREVPDPDDYPWAAD